MKRLKIIKSLWKAWREKAGGSNSLEGKTIVIFGTSSGRGRATVRFICNLVAMVILLGKNSRKLDDTIQLLDDKRGHLVN